MRFRMRAAVRLFVSDEYLGLSRIWLSSTRGEVAALRGALLSQRMDESS